MELVSNKHISSISCMNVGMLAVIYAFYDYQQYTSCNPSVEGAGNASKSAATVAMF
jgi:hypothetical protein